MSKINELLRDPSVLLVQAHQCRFGFVAPLRDGIDGVGPAKEPTGFMTNRPCIAEALDRQCLNDHTHVPLIAGRAEGAAVYPYDLCEAMCKCLLQQKTEGLGGEDPGHLFGGKGDGEDYKSFR